MPGPPRRRIDFTRLPAVPRFALAFAVLAVVIGLVLLARRDSAPAQPAGWYTWVVRVGAVGLLLCTAAWLVRQAIRMWRRR